MNVRKWTAVFAALLVFMMIPLLSACGDDPIEDYLPSIVPPLDVAITDCLSAAEVSAIMGADMTASEPYEDGTWVVYSTADGMRSVSVNMVNKTEALYDAMLAELSDGVAVTELGPKAYWYASVNEVIFYCKGYAIGVSVTDSTVLNTGGLCRAIARKLQNNLSAE